VEESSQSREQAWSLPVAGDYFSSTRNEGDRHEDLPGGSTDRPRWGNFERATKEHPSLCNGAFSPAIISEPCGDSGEQSWRSRGARHANVI